MTGPKKKKNKRKERGSDSSSKSPAAKKHHSTRDDDVSDSSDLDSDSDSDEDVVGLIKALSTQLKEQKKLLKEAAKKQEHFEEKFDERMGGMEERLASIDIRTAEQGKAINVVQRDIAEVQQTQKKYAKEVESLKSTLVSAENAVRQLEDKSNALERYSRRNNLRLVGIPEQDGENPADLVQGVLKDDLGMESVGLESAHRVGKARTIDGKKTRHLIFKLTRFTDKIAILQKKREALNGKDYYITDDLTDSDMEKKRALRPVMEEARKKHQSVKFVKGQLFIDQRRYVPPCNEGNDSG